MKKVTLKKLSVENYKKFEAREFDFAGRTEVSGRNRQGKTSLMDAYFDVLTGKLADGTLPNNIRRKVNGEEVDDPVVRELVIDVDGTKYVVQKKTKKGKSSNTVEYYVNGIKRNKTECVLVRTPEENEKLLKEAEKQGITWKGRDYCRPLKEQTFPNILKIFKDESIVHNSYIDANFAFYEASELFGEKGMTARKFADRIADLGNCNGRNCSECVLNKKNNKCKCNLCDISEWKDNIDELLEIAASGKATVLSPEEKAIDTLENFIENPDRAALNDEFIEALNLAVEKMKEVK